jgi:hypothetical protein
MFVNKRHSLSALLRLQRNEQTVLQREAVLFCGMC